MVEMTMQDQVKMTNPGKDFLRFITHLEDVHQRRREKWRQFRGGDIVRKRWRII
jgi:hypothetical protein